MMTEAKYYYRAALFATYLVSFVSIIYIFGAMGVWSVSGNVAL